MDDDDDDLTAEEMQERIRKKQEYQKERKTYEPPAFTCEFVKFSVYSSAVSESRNIAVPRELHSLVFGTDTSIEYLIKENILAENNEARTPEDLSVDLGTTATAALKLALRYGSRKIDVRWVVEVGI